MLILQQRNLKLMVVMLFSLSSGFSLALDSWIGKVDLLIQEERYISVDDNGFKTNPFTIVREYGGSEDERLALTRVQLNAWVLVEYEYDENGDQKMARVIELFSGESAALKAKEELDEESDN